jgi:glucosamine-6-phosphate deaminase
LIKAAGGIDLQLLGIGRNGHLGFAEPGSSLASRTGLVVLTEETVTDNARFFDSPDQVPRYAITMGVATILEARSVLLLASGSSKAGAVARAVEGPITSQVPASALQLHPDVTLLVDEEAAFFLEHRDYYRRIEEARTKLAAPAA